MSLERPHAILRVRYRNEAKGQHVSLEVESEQSMLDKIKELKSNPQVIHIGVFPCNHLIDLQERWVETPYKAITEVKPAEA